MKKIHLHTQITFYLVLITLALQLLTGLILFNYANHLVKRSVLNNTQASITQVSANIESFFRYAETLSFSLLLNQELQDRLTASARTHSERALKRLEINFILNRQFFLEQFIRRIYILSPDVVYSTIPVTNEASIDELRAYIKQFGDVQAFSTNPYLSDFSGNLRFEQGYFIAYGRPYRRISDQTLLGHIIIELDYLAILEVIDSYANTYGGSLSLFGSDGTAFPGSGYQEFPFVHTEFLTELINDGKTGLFPYKDLYYIVNKNESTGWYLVANFPARVIDFDGRILMLLTLGLLGGSLILSIVLGSYMAKNLTFPIQNLQEHMKIVHQNSVLEPLPLPARSRTVVEIEGLYNEFEDMTQRISLLIQQIHIEHTEKNQIELNLHQNRINPHFLYNTLESFTWLARLHNSPIISDALSKLIRLLRKNVYNNTVFIPLREEIDFIQDYLDLLSFIKGIKIELVVSIPEKIAGFEILKMLIQPFIENTIFHGFAGKKTGCTIWITVIVIKENVEIMIEDNGRGYDTVTPDELTPRNKFSGIGISNVESRLFLFYGDKARIFTESNNQGTKVKLLLPKFKDV